MLDRSMLTHLQQTAVIIAKYTEHVAEILDAVLLQAFGGFGAPNLVPICLLTGSDDRQGMWIEKGLQVCSEMMKVYSPFPGF